jgi:hypothetical protein
MALADLDHNGMLETILTVAAGLPTTENSLTMHVFQPDGSERPGWPVNLGGVNPDDVTFTHLMVGDLNRDGTEEIIEAHMNGVLNILEPDGTAFPGFTASFTGGMSGAMALADVDGDGFPEILVVQYQGATFNGVPLANSSGAPAAGTATVHTSVDHDGIVSSSATSLFAQSQAGIQYLPLSLLALRRDGSVARTWNLQGNGGNQPAATPPTITVGDFNNDGLTDIAINYMMVLGGGTSGFLGGGQAVVLTTGAPFNAAANDWPLVYQNPHNTGVMRRALTVSLTSPVGGGSVAGTTAITATTTGNVASVQFQIDGTNFGPPVTTAPFTIYLWRFADLHCHCNPEYGDRQRNLLRWPDPNFRGGFFERRLRFFHHVVAERRHSKHHSALRRGFCCRRVGFGAVDANRAAGGDHGHGQ